jgi:hypothetical protein
VEEAREYAVVNTTTTTIVVALVGLISAVLGGLVQAVAARRFEQIKFDRQAKWELYSNYFVAIAELTFAPEGSERHRNALSYMAQVRGRLAVVAPPSVVQAVGAVFRFPDLLSLEARAAMARALEEMRNDVGQKNPKADHDALTQLVLGDQEFDNLHSSP